MTLDALVAAAHTLAPRFPDARFVIVGYADPTEWEYEASLKTLTAKLGLTDRVIFTGLRQDVPSLLAAEITARTGRDPGRQFEALTSELGTPYSTRIDYAAKPETVVDDFDAAIVRAKGQGKLVLINFTGFV